MKNFKTTYAIFLIAIGMCLCPVYDTPAAENIEKVLADFEAYAQKGLEECRVPGMAIGIVRGDELIYAKGFGVKTVGGTDAVTTKTIFQIGSTSKAFTSTMAGMLADDGKFKWDDKVVETLPDFMMYDPWVTREFQVVDLMSQHSGMPGYAADSLSMFGFNRREIRHAIRYIKPVNSFRSKFTYVNNLWLVADELIEKKSGKSWEENLKERIFVPLGMTETSADMQSFQQAQDMASLHVEVEGKVIALPKDWEYLHWSYVYGAAGAINSNIADMAKWLSFQVNNGKVKDKQLISEKNLHFLRTPKTCIETEPGTENMAYCMGWMCRESRPYPVIWHNGGTTSMKTMVAFIPQEKIGIVILSNLITDLPEHLAFKFFERYTGKSLQFSDLEKLAASGKAKKESEDKKPDRPKDPAPPMALEKYAGVYANDIYGTVNVAVSGGKLTLTIGPKHIRMTLAPWDRDTFMLYWAFYGTEAESGFVGFEVDPEGNVTGMRMDSLNEDGCGVFKRVK